MDDLEAALGDTLAPAAAADGGSPQAASEPHQLALGSTAPAQGGPHTVASVPPAPGRGAPLARGDRVARYVVLDALGAGAMGAVYAAYDPDLDRKIALKLLHARAATSDGQRARVLREAQALARISHPGVVGVHDVGWLGDQMFIAMEFVAGGTLTKFLQDQKGSRDWRSLVEVLASAGRGLAAAHAAGLVHRDVKPDNILIDARGMARIGDFGLAAGRGEQPQRPSAPSVAVAESPFAAELTASHALVGTPAYMAPEQLAGEPATQLSDQFGFCATLYEALFGVRPYPGSTLGELSDRFAAGVIAEPEADPGVPARVRFAIARGLAVDPARRHPSMDALLDALSPRPWSRHRIAIVGTLCLVTIATTAFVLGGTGSAQEPPCRTAGAEVARVWNAQRRAQIESAILRTGAPFAADTWQRVARGMDAYATSWRAMHRQACEATAVHRTQSPELLDRRIYCLDRRLLDVDATLTTLAATEAASVRHAVRVVEKLPSLTACADPDRLVSKPPAETKLASEIERLSRDVARANAKIHAAQPREAATIASAAVTAAEGTSYPPLVAEASYTLGKARLEGGDIKGARGSFVQAVAAAASAGHHELEARALANLALVLRTTSPDGAFAVAHAKHALAIAERLRRDPLLEAEILYANVRVSSGIDAAAVNTYVERGLARIADAEAAGIGPGGIKLDYQRTQAAMQMSASDALERLDIALATAKRIYGERHPQVAAVLVEMAHYAALDEQVDTARAYGRQAAELLGPYPGDRVALLRIDARLETDLTARRSILERVVEESRAQNGPDSPQLASDHESAADTLLELGAYREGLAHINDAIRIWETAYGGHYEGMITSLTTKAQLLAGVEDWQGVSEAAERANAIVDHGGMRELVKVMARLLLMDSYFRQGRFADALTLVEQIGPTIKLALLGDPSAAMIDFYQAACEWELRKDRPGALRRAREAYATMKTSPSTDAASLAYFADWLRQRR